MKPYVLVLHDLTPDWPYACDPALLSGALRRIELAKRHGCPIVGLEMKDHRLWRVEGVTFDTPQSKMERKNLVAPRTHPAIMRALDGYDRVAFRLKPDGSGALVLVYGCADNGFVSDEFEFVGGERCLYHTIAELREQLRPLARLRVVRDAATLDDSDEDCWHHLNDFDVELVPGGPLALPVLT